MAKLLRIERAIQWIARTLVANRDANPNPEGVIDQILPVIDTFGSSRADQMQFATVSGALGLAEVFHGPVPVETVRQYLSMEFAHDDIVNQIIRPGRIIATATGFPFASLRDQESVAANERRTIRNFTIGPGDRAAARTNALGAGARLSLVLVWVDTPLGEYLRSIQ